MVAYRERSKTGLGVKIYTKKGDQGQTGLLGGQRISKTDPRPEAYGTIDEVCTVLGVVRASSENESLTALIHQIQQDLFVMGAELATAEEDRERFTFRITADQVAALEHAIDEHVAQIELPRAFIVPGSSSYVPALLDWARAVARRTERRVVALNEAGLLPNPEVLKYLNRLADLLFVLARYQEALDGKGAVLWRGKDHRP